MLQKHAEREREREREREKLAHRKEKQTTTRNGEHNSSRSILARALRLPFDDARTAAGEQAR